MAVNGNSFLDVGLSILQFEGGRTQKNIDRFCVAFGACPEVCSAIFNDLRRVQFVVDRLQVTALLMTLHWLYRYPTETLLCSMFGFQCEQTVRELIDRYLVAICTLKPMKVMYHCITKVLHCASEDTNI